MNNNENNDQRQISNEDLLRFLETGPQLVRHRDNRKSPRLGGNQSDCPNAESYMNLASGLTENGDTDELLAHAATCSACADVLSRSLGAMDGNPSPEEAAAIAELAAARREWQQRLARDLAATPARKRSPIVHPGRWVGGSAIAAGLVLAAGLILLQKQNNTPEHQLAMAYEQSRSLELRIPEAKYAALTSGGRTRGALANREPSKLLDARARLARELERSPQDPHWLELQARADILEERYNSATDVLDRLIAQGPVNSELLADAASAYFQRGLVSGSELDRSTALDYLRRADEMAPTDPVILFNEAIVMEDRGQMMNAVEVWNRYVTVERDPKWVAEGKRKLAALEQTLNRLKSHESRINQMLATPTSMEALARDAPKLASLDEELSTYDLNKLLQDAYPLSGGQTRQPASANTPEARGSPCNDSCLASRILLKAIGASLELKHHDSWLTDLLSPDFDKLPIATATSYAQALHLLGQATEFDNNGVSPKGAEKSEGAETLFRNLKVSGRATPALLAAASVGLDRSTVEFMMALQTQVKFQECRLQSQRFHAGSSSQLKSGKYPWIDAVERITEKVCDDTPETRSTGRNLLLTASHLAEVDHYRLLKARINMRLVDDSQNAGDEEAAEHLTMSTLRELYAGDPPPFRITYTMTALDYIEGISSRAHTAVLTLQESLFWYELLGNHAIGSVQRMDLARAEMRIGAMKEAQRQLALAQEERDSLGSVTMQSNLETEPDILLSSSLLEQGDLGDAEKYLDRASAHMLGYSDSWGLRAYAAARGQLELASGNFNAAAETLESEIRSSEGRNVRRGDKESEAEYGAQDHDLYAELAAVWLAVGRSPESVLALWERFRLRSRGLPIVQCIGGALDCEQPFVTSAQRDIGEDLLIGQILLLDRVLVYRADKNQVTWSEKRLRRQDVLDGAQTFERAVSSPFTSLRTASQLGAYVAEALLPVLPANMPDSSTLLLEPDPMLQNLSWPVLPTPSGPLGMQFPLAEMRSILATRKPTIPGHSSGFSISDQALVVGASMAAGEMAPLPDALKEARNVNRFLNSSELLLGEQATSSNVAARLGSATIFHFAGHSVQTKNGTELLLAADRPNEQFPWVDGEFLRQHPPRACRLAVLSACATGSRDASWDHPLQDMVETLSALGVPAVVATRWQIDSGAAVPLMNDFYASLAKGNSVAMALTSARRVQFGQSLYNNPYYWGAYYVTGTESTRPTGELNARF